MSHEDRAAELCAEVERLKAQVAMQGTELCSVHEDGKRERDRLAERNRASDDRWVDERELAKILSLSTNTLKNWRARGIGPPLAASAQRRSDIGCAELSHGLNRRDARIHRPPRRFAHETRRRTEGGPDYSGDQSAYQSARAAIEKGA